VVEQEGKRNHNKQKINNFNCNKHYRNNNIIITTPIGPPSSSFSSDDDPGLTSQQRRSTIQSILSCCGVASSALFVPHKREYIANAATATSTNTNTDTATSYTLKGIVTQHDNADTLSSFKYQMILGQGSYKTVYLVSTRRSSSQTDPEPSTSSWAVAVEKIQSKKDARKALRGIIIIDELQRKLEEGGDASYIHSFEQIQGWWFQSTPLPRYEKYQQVFFPQDVRSQKVPTKFLGRTKYLISFKPVYDIDLQRLKEKASTVYPIPNTTTTTTTTTTTITTKKSTNNKCRTIGGIDLNNPRSALQLAYELCDIGHVMHLYGLIHRDIKAKNIMLSKGKPVIIDFGFASFVVVSSTTKRDGRLCIEEPGTIKGERSYMLSDDAANYKACTEGDTYAMGKTLYETIFQDAAGSYGNDPLSNLSSSTSASESSSSSSTSSSSSSSSSTSRMTVEKVRIEETKFRNVLANENSWSKSRFVLTYEGRDRLMYIIRGLCRKENPMSFGEASDYLKEQLTLNAKNRRDV
jgi:serine/threonine protein kinase